MIGCDETRSQILIHSGYSKSEFSVASQISWPRFIAEARLVYYDHSDEVVGVIDTQAQKVLWTSPVIGGETEWFLGGNRREVLVQSGTVLTSHDVDSGDILHRSERVDALCAAGDGWSAFLNGDHLRFEIDNEVFGFRNKLKRVRDFFQEGERLVIFDYFGSAQLFNLRPFHYIGEIRPDPDASFVAAHLDSGRYLRISQTSPTSTVESLVHHYTFDTQDLVSTAAIPCGGDMAFWRDGTEIGFRTLISYSTSDGGIATKLGEWG